MSRAIYVPPEEQKRLFANTLADPVNGVRNHAILRLMYGYPIRAGELSVLKTHDLATDQGIIRPRSESELLRAEISFSGEPRPFPLQCPIIIDALQKWLDQRFEKSWGIIDGHLDMEAPFFLKNKTEGFTITRTKRGDKITKSPEGMNRLIAKLHRLNEIEGNVETPLRTWTLIQHERGVKLKNIWTLRGDKTIETVRSVCRNHPVKLASMVASVI